MLQSYKLNSFSKQVNETIKKRTYMHSLVYFGWHMPVPELKFIKGKFAKLAMETLYANQENNG